MPRLWSGQLRVPLDLKGEPSLLRLVLYPASANKGVVCHGSVA